MKCPTFNVDSTLILKLVSLIIRKRSKVEKMVDTCPSPHGLDEDTLKLIISKEKNSGDIIEVEKENDLIRHEPFELKEEWKEDSIKFKNYPISKICG